jgi:tetratricopeptide (TPR) repeat protein
MLAVVMAGLLLSTPPGDVEQARSDFERGAALYRAGDFRAALAAFEAAQARAPTPQTLFNIARCQERLGQLADAADSYSAYLAAAPDAPDRTAVSARIDELRARLPLEASLRISVEPQSVVSVDGEPAGLSPISVRLRPGAHHVRATQDGYQPLERDVELAPGGRVQLELSLVPLIPPVAATEQVPEAAVRDTVGPAPRQQPRRWTYVAAGLAAACLTAGITFGVSASRAQDTLKDGTPRSPEQVQQIYDTAVARSAAANGFYAAAGVAGATAIALFFLEPHFGGPSEAR